MSGMKHIHATLAIFLVTSLVFLSGFAMPDASAQEVPQSPSISLGDPTTKVNATSVETVINATLNKLIIFNLSEPAVDIHLGQEAIADVRVNPKDQMQVFIEPHSIGSTNILFTNKEGDLIERLIVNVGTDAEELRQALKILLPDESISLEVHGDSIFLTGDVKSASASASAMQIAERFVEDPANLINMLTIVGSQQVIIQVRVSEMDRSMKKDLDVGLTGNFNQSNTALSFTTLTPSVTDAFVSGGTITNLLGGIDSISFDVLESQSMIKTLAEPTLTALSGETATFTSGGETPVRTGTDDAGDAVYELADYGILLEFTPVVLEKGMISLNVSTTVSEVDTTTVSGQTGFLTKSTETTVNLPSGGSMMISGLLQDNASDAVSGFPFLKDLPILGALFRSTSFQRDETELVITVTAYLAEPTGNNNPLKVPTDGFKPASDIDLYLLGRLHKEYGKGKREFWADSLNGPFGYIMK